MQIHKTNDYTIFKKHPSNRAIDQCNLKKITASIKAKNMLELRPIIVNPDMQIIDGQHRLEAAKLLVEPVFYQIQKTTVDEDIILLNNQKVWVIDDYINFYCSKYNENYLKLVEYTKNKSMTASRFICLTHDDRGETLKKIRAGTYVFPNALMIEELNTLMIKAHTVLDLLTRFSLQPSPWLKHQKLLEALFSLLRNESVDFGTFMKKLNIRSDTLHSCTSAQSYYIMFRDMYNFKNSLPME